MTKRIQAKYKIDRRMGENIWGRPKSPINLRSYGPGQHGQGRKGKLSDFGLQMRAKQKLKGYYGNITEKQFKRIFFSRQKSPKVFEMNASFYIFTRNFLIKKNKLFNDKTSIFEMPRERSIDIDDFLDLKLVKYLIKNDKKLFK